MPFIKDILKYSSLSIVGMEKNTGKTTCLNYILRNLKDMDINVAVSSIGVDGENTDIIYKHSKPDINIYENMVFATSEKHYHQKKICAEILSVSSKKTAMGRLVNAKALSKGKVVLSGPSDTLWLKKWIDGKIKAKTNLIIVDGALSRLSSGAPSVTDAIVLNTGAAVSQNIETLVSKTNFIVDLIKTNEYKTNLQKELLKLDNGVYSIKNNNIIKLNIPSILMIDKYKEEISKHGNHIYTTGVVTDKLLDFLRRQKNANQIRLIVKDFTKMFISKKSYLSYIKSGAELNVLLKTKLIAICVNPVSNSGYSLDSEKIINKLKDKTKLPVYNICTI